MATARQTEANRLNAKKSTGPKTAAGIKVSRMNALKHGLSSVHTILLHEDPTEYHEMRASLLDTWKPANAQEMMLVDCIAAGWLAMQRTGRFESAMFTLQVEAVKDRHGLDLQPSEKDDMGIVVAMSDEKYERAFSTYFRYGARAESRYYRAMDHLRQVQADRQRQERELARTVAPAPACTIPAAEPAPEVVEFEATSEKLASFGETAAEALPPDTKPAVTLSPQAAPARKSPQSAAAEPSLPTSTPVSPSSTLTVAHMSSSA
jgi:hypothetical protein